MSLEQGIYGECFREIDFARRFEGLGRKAPSRPVFKPMARCRGCNACSFGTAGGKVLRPGVAAGIAATGRLPAMTNSAPSAITRRRRLTDIKADHMKDLLAYWRDRRYRGQGLPTVGDISPDALHKIASDRYHILRSCRSGSYKIVRFAPALASDLKEDWTTMVVREHPCDTYGKAMHDDYQEAEWLGSPLHEEVAVETSLNARHFHRLILPLMGQANQPTFLVGVDF